MLQKQIRGKRMIVALGALGTLGLVLAGCASQRGSSTQPGAAAAPQMAGGKSGAQLWAENCMRCHYLRPPESYSAAEWEVIVHHMRLRAGLTGQEQRAITQFLQASRQGGT